MPLEDPGKPAKISSDKNIPAAEISHVRVRATDSLQQTLEWYNQTPVRIDAPGPAGTSVSEYWEVCLEFRKKLFNILKNDYIKRAYDALALEEPQRSWICKTYQTEMIAYLSLIINDPQYEHVLPSVLTKYLAELAQYADWTLDSHLVALRVQIRQAMKIPAKKKKI